MKIATRLEQATVLDSAIRPLQSIVRRVPATWRDVLHGVWLGHPAHPLMVQIPVGAWFSATALGTMPGNEGAVRALTVVGLAGAGPAAASGAADWAEQHEQQLRVGVVHAATNWAAIGCFSASLLCRTAGARQRMRLAGLAAVGLSGLLGGHMSFRLASGANHAEAVPHIVEPGWHPLLADRELPDGKPVRVLIGETPVVAVRERGLVRVLADRCSHMSGPLSEGSVAEGKITCPWHGSTFCLADGSVTAGPATAPQPAFESRICEGQIQVRLPGAG